MRSFTDLFARLLRRIRPIRRPIVRRGPSKARLAIESLEDRCVPTASPWVVDSNHNLLYGSTVVEKNVEEFQWSSSAKLGYVLQQGGAFQNFSSSDPTCVHATIGSGVESFALGSGSTVYDLLAGGKLQKSTNSGSSWSTLDTKTESFALTTTGAIYDLEVGGQLMVLAPGGSLQVSDYNVISFTAAANGTLYKLIDGGLLEASTDSGNSWITMDTATESFSVDGSGNLYDLDAGAGLWVLPPGGCWQFLDGYCQAFAVAPNGTLYDLTGGGILQTSSNLGATWTTVDCATEAFSLTANGTLYDLNVAGGSLRVQYSPGGSWTSLDTATQTFGLSANGTLFDLDTGGKLRSLSTTGGSWTTLDTTTQTFVITANGTLYSLDTGGSLRASTTGSTSFTTFDTTTQSFAVIANGMVFNLLNGGILENAAGPSGAWNGLDNITQSFGVDSNGTLYDLDFGGQLWDLPLGGYWQYLDDNTQSFSVNANGVVYNLVTGGFLEWAAGPTNSWNQLDNISVSFAVTPNGTLYDMDSDQSLWDLPAGGCWQWLDNVAQSFALSPNGTLFDLDTGGSFWALPSSGYWVWLSNNTQSFAVAGNGAVFDLIDNGVLERTTNLGSSWTTLNSSTQAFALTANGTIDAQIAGALDASINTGSTWVNWFSFTLPDSGVANLAQLDYTRDTVLTRADFIGLFAETEADGVITATELSSLQALANTTIVPMPAAVRDLAGKVVDGDPANANFEGQALGNVVPGASGVQMNDLVQKWFYGADHPQTDIDWTTGEPFQYALASGSLFGPSGVPSFNDVAQGDAADCYFLAALGQIALQSPATIESMFTNNGDGTYTVRFYVNGVADYVTVDSYLPVASDGTYAYANYDQYGQVTYVSTGSNVLWVALAEKAYAQLAEEGWSRADHGEYANSYDSIGYGWSGVVMEQITGSITDTLIVPAGADATPNAEAALLNDIAQNHLITIGTFGTLPDSNSAFIGNHCYTLESYDPTTGLFTFINPYDDGGSQRVVQVTWDELLPYVAYFDDVTAPADMNVSSIISNY
jgi:hypothetical protein